MKGDNAKLGNIECEERGLFPEEVQALISSPHQFLRSETARAVQKSNMHELLIRLLYDTWAREDEIRMVKVKDIDKDQRLIRLRNTKKRTVKRTSEEIVTERKIRVVDFSKETKKLLVQYLQGKKTGYLFEGQERKPISLKTIRNIIHRYAEAVGIQRTIGWTKDGRQKRLVHPHALREAGEAFAIIMGGMDRETAAAKAGHGLRVQEKYYMKYHAVRARIASDEARRRLKKRFV